MGDSRRWAAGIALLLFLAPAEALYADDTDDQDDVLDHVPVYFVNQASDTATVTVDGKVVCQIEPGATCSTVVDVNEADYVFDDWDQENTVRVDVGDRYIEDHLYTDKCDFGREEFTFHDTGIFDFKCWKGK